MAEDRSILGTILIIGAAMGAGALIAYLILKPKSSSLSELDVPGSISSIQPPTTHPMPSPSGTITNLGPAPSYLGMGGLGTIYNNKEKWKIVRNNNGDIDSIEVIRDANIDARV